MKIAIARPTSALRNTSFEGQINCYEYLADYYDLEIDVICRADSELSTNADKLNYITVSQNPSERIKHNVRELKTKVIGLNENVNMPEFSDIHLILAGQDYDVVEVSDPRLYGTALLAKRAIDPSDANLVIVAEASKNLSSHITEDHTKEVLDRSSGIILSSPRAHRSFTESGLLSSEDSRIVYTGHPIDTDMFSPVKHSKKNRVKLLSVGHIERRKGYKDICKALSNVDNQIDFSWHIVGSGELREWIKSFSKEQGFYDQITFYGRVKHDIIPRFYQNADIFVLHSKETETWEEYFGVAYAEAMSSALPVIGSQSGAIPWVVRDGHAGILPEEGDTEAITKAILEFANDVEKRYSYGKEGRKNVTDRFSLKSVADSFYDAWEM